MMSAHIRQTLEVVGGRQQPVLSIDGVRRAVPAGSAAPTRPPSPPARPRFQPPATARRRPGLLARFWGRIRLPLLLVGGITGGMLLQQAWFGSTVIVIYGVLSLIFHVPSRTTFALALISLGAVCAVLVAGSNREVAHSFATYTFLLLVFGVIALNFEVKPQKRRKRRNGR